MQVKGKNVQVKDRRYKLRQEGTSKRGKVKARQYKKNRRKDKEKNQIKQ